jgi:hypothetical protein
METWLLTDESVIKKAVDEEGSNVNLGLPGLSELENTRQAKEKLYNAIKRAAGYDSMTKRRKNEFDRQVHRYVHYVAENLTGIDNLFRLDAFKKFYDNLCFVLDSLTLRDKTQ